MTCRRMIVGSAALLLLAAGGAGDARAQDPQELQRQNQQQNRPQSEQGRTQQQNQQSQAFVQKAAMAGMYEVQAAEMAVEKAKTEHVRAFARRMIADHQQANRELESLASQREWKVPSALDANHGQMLERLSRLEGEDFDMEYMEQQLQAHQEAVALFQQQAQRGEDEALTSWANQKLATLRTHLHRARDVKGEDAARSEKGTSRQTTAPDTD